VSGVTKSAAGNVERFVSEPCATENTTCTRTPPAIDSTERVARSGVWLQLGETHDAISFKQQMSLRGSSSRVLPIAM
jgi:hypothetical protein